MITVRLNKKELSEARQHSNFRLQLSLATNLVNQRRGNKWGEKDIEYLGVRAEIAVAKLFGFDSIGMGIDDGSDFYFDEVSIDVKATFYKNGRLIFRSRDKVKADVIVLVNQVSEEVLNIEGWCTKEHYLKKAEVKDLGNGSTLVLEPENLFPIEELWLYLQQQRHSA